MILSPTAQVAVVKKGEFIYEYHIDPPRLTDFEDEVEEFDPVQLEHQLNWYTAVRDFTLGSFACHYKRILNADMNIPVTLLPNGDLLDGIHRALHGLIYKVPVKARRLKKMPLAKRYNVQEFSLRHPTLYAMLVHNEEVDEEYHAQKSIHRS